MRVGVYVDGYNLYYGARRLVSERTGWKWLDVRGLVTELVSAQRGWTDARVDRVVYCTARIDARLNPDGQAEQDVYLKALLASGSVDHIEYGKYVTGVRVRPLAVQGPRRGRPELVTATWPVMVQSSLGAPQADALFMVSTLHQEEKGSDVNVATHLLTDVFTDRIDAAVVVSNDSDLRLPIQFARTQVPLGLVNPRNTFVAGDLRGNRDDGVGGHWWSHVSADALVRHQLPSSAGGYRKPEAW